MGEVKEFHTRLDSLNGAIEEDKDRGILIVTYSTRQHTRKKHIPLSAGTHGILGTVCTARVQQGE